MARDTNSRATAAEKHAKALELRRAGLTYDEIAQRVGYANRTSARRAVENALAKITREPAEQLLKLQLEQLNDMWRGIYGPAIGGDVYAIDRALKIMERTGKLAGVDALTGDSAQQQAAADALAAFMQYAQATSSSPDDDEAAT